MNGIRIILVNAKVTLRRKLSNCLDRSKVKLRRESRNCWDIEALQDLIRIKCNFELSFFFSRYKHVVLHCRKTIFLKIK